MANLWASFKPFPDWELNSALYFTDTSFMYDPHDVKTMTPEFFVWNLGVNWKPNQDLRLSLWGMDLEGVHTETLQSAFISPAQVVPSFYAQATLEF